MRPIYGKKIDQLLKAYLIEDYEGKREIEQIIQILYVKAFSENLGIETQSTLVPPPKERIQGEYPLGYVSYIGKKLYPYGLRENDWIKHVLIVGASGSGKTNLCSQILGIFCIRKSRSSFSTGNVITVIL